MTLNIHKASAWVLAIVIAAALSLVVGFASQPAYAEETDQNAEETIEYVVDLEFDSPDVVMPGDTVGMKASLFKVTERAGEYIREEVELPEGAKYVWKEQPGASYKGAATVEVDQADASGATAIMTINPTIPKEEGIVVVGLEDIVTVVQGETVIARPEGGQIGIVADFDGNLKNYGIFIESTDYVRNYEDVVCYVDEVAAKKDGAPLGVTEDQINLTYDNVWQDYDSEYFELTAEKYMGYNESTGEDVWKKASFPLVIDPAGTKDVNGNRTDGTAIYRIKAKAKSVEGNLWSGETEPIYYCVWSKYSLYNFSENYGAEIRFADLNNKYIKEIDDEPYWRYEVPKGVTSKGPTVTIGGQKLTNGKDIAVTYIDKSTKKTYTSFPKTAGTYTVKITGKSPYYGEDTSTQVKVGLKNTIKVKGKTLTVKAKAKKTKKKKTYKRAKAISVKKAKGSVTYKKVKGNKKITVASNGKVTVKKGLKRGTYKVKVSVTAAGNNQYFPLTKKVTFKVRVR